VQRWALRPSIGERFDIRRRKLLSTPLDDVSGHPGIQAE
jgi:hypothetical protein